MSPDATALTGARIFDGAGFLDGHALVIEGGQIAQLLPQADLPASARRQRLAGGVIGPGFIDLQVNGGGGVMFNASPDVASLRVMAAAHARIGATTILPTLITDTEARMRAAVTAVAEAVAAGVAGIAGLHLEGPFLAPSRHGAHDRALIRPLSGADLDFLTAAARALPLLKVTLAPEVVDDAAIRRLAEAGVLVSLGHSEADFDTCAAAARAGARCVTHLFNAQSPLGHRAPGMVGAALDLGQLSAGVIADGVHVHPAALAVALRAKRGPGRLFLVSDAMATAG
uniref:N-acetylglucosamine-6-phosphate deacetylase n=1 Tax=Shimia sp. TaxID=1954381 RepID=UPI003567BD1D